MEDIIYEFKNIVEESRTEDRQDYYIKLRNALDLLEKLEEENKELEEKLENSIPKSYIEEQLNLLEKMRDTSEEVSGFWSKRAMLKKFLKYKRKEE